MPTLNKLEYLDETKQQIKTALNTNFNSQIQDTDTFRSYVSKIKDIYTNWHKVTGEDTALTLSPTKKGLMSLDLKGNTSQEGTPTPETPQDIHVVSGDNSIVVCGKNLVNVANISGSLSSQYYQDYETGYTLEVGKTYTLSLNANVSVTPFLFSIGCGVNSYAKDILTKSGQQNGRIYITFTPTTEQLESGNKLFIRCPRYATQQNATYTLSDIMLNEGSTALPYEPYESQSYPINLGDIELCKIGDYQDSIVKDNGKWYFKKEIGKLDNDIVIISYNSTYGYYTIAPNITGAGAKTYSSTLSNHFQKTGPLRIVGSNSTNLWLWDENNYFQNATEVKQFMIDNNVKTYYILNTPTYTEITDSTLISQLEAIKTATSYDTQTNISQTNNDLPFIISASALMKGGN